MTTSVCLMTANLWSRAECPGATAAPPEDAPAQGPFLGSSCWNLGVRAPRRRLQEARQPQAPERSALPGHSHTPDPHTWGQGFPLP